MDATLKQACKRYEFLFEENRRKTFKKWVFSDEEECNADKMAEAGFIFIGNKIEPDAVKCFLCEKSLDGWDSTDNPWQEHLKHSPKCPFAKLQKPDSLMVTQFIDIVHALSEKIITLYFDKKTDDVEKKFDDYEKKILSKLEKK